MACCANESIWMADQQLLSRRQILALFGAGTGMAIVGAQGQQTQPSADGNVLGGADNMPAPYKVGESTYKGPLSVRSEVPQEDGITFIQTDAGNNDQFALHHYNGGWGQQGLDVTSLDADELLHTKHVLLKTYDGTQAYAASEYGSVLDAFLAARDDAINAGYGSVETQLPYATENNGTIDVSSTLDLKEGNFEQFKLIGQGGWGENTLQGTTFRSSISDGSDVITTSGSSSYFVLRDIQIKGDGTEGYGLYVGANDVSEVNNIGAQNCGNNGKANIFLGGLEYTASELMSKAGANDGIVHGGSYLHVNNVEVEDASRHGYNVQDGDNNTLEAPFEVEYSGSAGLFAWAATNLTIRGSGFRANNNGTWGINLEGKPIRGSRIEAVNTHHNANGAVKLAGAEDAVVIGCTFADDSVSDALLKLAPRGGVPCKRVTVINNVFSGNSTDLNVDSGSVDIHIDKPTFNGEQEVAPSSSTYTATFDCKMSHTPEIDVVATGADLTGITMNDSDGDGNYESADLSFSATPTSLTWGAKPRNVPT